MDLITPGFGLIFWQTVVFLGLVFILGKYAWKPMLNAVKERETSIQESLSSAEKAREEMSKLKSDNEQLLAEARQERDKILKEALAGLIFHPLGAFNVTVPLILALCAFILTGNSFEVASAKILTLSFKPTVTGGKISKGS